MWTSSVFIDPNHCVSHTSSKTRSRLTTEPAFSISSLSSSNSLRLSSRTSPFSVTSRLAGSRRSSPISIGLSSVGAVVSVRRSTARMRATTSRALNGLTT